MLTPALRRRALALATALALVLGVTGFTAATDTARAATPAAESTFTTVGKASISGTPTPGKTLTAATGTWNPAPTTFSYQWMRSGVPIIGATTATYQPTTPDLDTKITVEVTAQRKGYAATAVLSGAVTIARALTATPTPVIAGTVVVGGTLSVTTGTWKPAPVTLAYQWYRNGTAISGATKSTYTAASADAGKKLTVRVTGSKAGYLAVAKTSAAVTVPRVLTTPLKVAVSGTAAVGQTLSAAAGSWGPTPVTLSYQWLRDGKSISKATAKTYKLVTADGGTRVSVRVTGKKSGYSSVARTSAAVSVSHSFSKAPTPTISGTILAGRTVSATAGTWSPSASLSYQWRVDGAVISGATARTWVVPDWAAGRSVTVSVTGKKSGYRTLTKTSAARSAAWSIGDQLLPGTPMRAGTYLESPNGAYRFTVQGDGNVVLSKKGTAQRSTRTTGTLDPVLVLQEDGNLAVYDGGDKPVWQAKTTGFAVHSLTLDNTGALRLVEVDGLAEWTGAKLAAYADSSAAGASVPGRQGWAYPIRPSATMTTYSGHGGDDFAAKTGTPVYSMRGGTVKVQEIWITSGCPSWAPNNTKQKQVLVTTTIDGTVFELTYAHLSAFSVKNGQTVKAGQKIGEVGSTGCSTGPHLHLGVKVDRVAKVLFPRDLLGTASY